MERKIAMQEKWKNCSSTVLGEVRGAGSRQGVEGRLWPGNGLPAQRREVQAQRGLL